ncbi:photosynthetic NDH subunit of subcomplex B 3, chloroplastic [Ricinus communis]|uniref:Electron carrier, putative n=1 Tax=Ricinus communis TaxID=3988 RepID=B9RQH9_RICCO|nr:photosynthetic NDH subunit of subcomplex B 3, chloroplastic [Ricinus communis]EEF46418.1 electron carrier, putative [Ricinus communis]|eukprot:XP_002515998.1 photosynthetic NDH subunit of subcomplex B 3, chloroplastic [Ricinus communis]
MGTALQLNSYGLANSLKASHNLKHSAATSTNNIHKSLKHSRSVSFSRVKIRAVGTVPDSKSDAKQEPPEEPPSVKFVFVHSVLLPDGTPDVHFRTTCGGQKLRDTMLDSNIDLYGPYGRPLLNCAGGGTCGSCMVEVVMGKELLSPRTEKEKKILKKKPKNWRLACQTTVGSPDSTGLVVIQQLPEWKAHEWKYEKILPPEISQ